MTLAEVMLLARKTKTQQVCLKINSTGKEGREKETIVNLRISSVQGSETQQLIYLHDVTNFLKAQELKN